MSQVPLRISIICQGCKKSHSPKEFAKAQGLCMKCNPTMWQLHAEFGNDAGGKGAPLADATLANIGVNVIGLGLLATTGVGFYVRPDTELQGTQSASNGVSDIYDISGPVLLAHCEPTSKAYEKLAAFIHAREQDLQRKRMLARGGNNCKHCGILFVPAADKPWTLVGTCSKVCCSRFNGVTEYAQIEQVVLDATRDASAHIQKAELHTSRIRIHCRCGQEIQFPKMYKGTYRKCTRCQERILVPLE